MSFTRKIFKRKHLRKKNSRKCKFGGVNRSSARLSVRIHPSVKRLTQSAIANVKSDIADEAREIRKNLSKAKTHKKSDIDKNLSKAKIYKKTFVKPDNYKDVVFAVKNMVWPPNIMLQLNDDQKKVLRVWPTLKNKFIRYVRRLSEPSFDWNKYNPRVTSKNMWFAQRFKNDSFTPIFVDKSLTLAEKIEKIKRLDYNPISSVGMARAIADGIISNQTVMHKLNTISE